MESSTNSRDSGTISESSGEELSLDATSDSKVMESDTISISDSGATSSMEQRVRAREEIGERCAACSERERRAAYGECERPEASGVLRAASARGERRTASKRVEPRTASARGQR
jgi:hypothetical protein